LGSQTTSETLTTAHPIEAQRGAAALVAGVFTPARFPVEPVQAEHQPLFLGQPDDVRDFDDGILQVGRDDFDIVLVERNELERLHGRLRGFWSDE